MRATLRQAGEEADLAPLDIAEARCRARIVRHTIDELVTCRCSTSSCGPPAPYVMVDGGGAEQRIADVDGIDVLKRVVGHVDDDFELAVWRHR